MLARVAAADFVRLAASAVEDHGSFFVALTGGESPGPLYRLLATGSIAAAVRWERVHLFWGDERAVPPAHPRSNYRIAREHLLSHVPIPPGNVHRMAGERGARVGATEYEARLRNTFPAGPRFDLVYLGVGSDGHVASLFPFDLPRLLEGERWVTESLMPRSGEPRITLTLRAINAAARVEFLLPSPGKARIAQRVLSGPLDPLALPAQLVRPSRGELHWRVLAGMI